MNKLIIALAALAAITLAAPTAQAGFDCDDDEDSIAECVRSFIPRKSFSMPSMPSRPAMPGKAQIGERPEAPKVAPKAERTEPKADAPLAKVAEKPARLGGPSDLCKKYFANIGQMIDVRCD